MTVLLSILSHLSCCSIEKSRAKSLLVGENISNNILAFPGCDNSEIRAAVLGSHINCQLWNNMSSPCFLCMKPTDLVCDHCSIPVCCDAHQRLHRSPGDDYCYPFKVCERPEVNAQPTPLKTGHLVRLF